MICGTRISGINRGRVSRLHLQPCVLMSNIIPLEINLGHKAFVEEAFGPSSVAVAWPILSGPLAGRLEFRSFCLASPSPERFDPGILESRT